MRVLPGQRDQLLAALVTAGSVFGDTAAQSALVLEAHASMPQAPWAISALLLAAAVPPAVAFPLVGALVDRFDSRQLMTLSATSCAVCCLELAMTTSYWSTLLLVSVLGVLASAGTTALNALIPALASPGRLGKVMAAQRGASLAGATAGLSLGGVLSDSLGTEFVLTLDAGSFVALGLGCAAIRTRRAAAVSPDQSQIALPRSARRTRAAKTLLSTHPVLLTASISAGAVGLFTTTTNVVQVFFVKDVVGTGNAGYGLITACWMAGMIAAVPLAGRLPDRLGPLVATTIAGESATGFVFLLCGCWPTKVVTAASYVAGGLASSAMLIARATLVQLLTPEQSRGRVQAAVGASRRVSGAVALGLGAVFLEMFGARGAFAFAGAGAVVTSAVGGLRLVIVLRHSQTSAVSDAPATMKGR